MTSKQHRPIGSFALAAMIAAALALAFGAAIARAADYEDAKDNVCEGGVNIRATVGCPTWGSHVTGTRNTALGLAMMPALTSGSFNLALGPEALVSDTFGGENVALGNVTLRANTSGGKNTATGSQALTRNETGVANTATGWQALFANTTGASNTADGNNALSGVESGLENVGIGLCAACSDATGNRNVGIGTRAGRNRLSGSNNIDISNEGATAEESGITRIGTEGTQTQTFVAGIYGKTLAGATCSVAVNSEGQLGCATAASTSASFEFGTGSANLGNKKFVGLGTINGTEGMVQQSVAPSGTLTNMTCFQNGTASAAVTYTLRDNSGSTTLTCTIAAGSTRGVGTGSVAFASGDLLDVMTPASGTPGKPGSFSVSTG